MTSLIRFISVVLAVFMLVTPAAALSGITMPDYGQAVRWQDGGITVLIAPLSGDDAPNSVWDHFVEVTQRTAASFEGVSVLEIDQNVTDTDSAWEILDAQDAQILIHGVADAEGIQIDFYTQPFIAIIEGERLSFRFFSPLSFKLTQDTRDALLDAYLSGLFDIYERDLEAARLYVTDGLTYLSLADPNTASVTTLRGYTDLMTRRFEEARLDFSRVIELSPEDGVAYANRAQSLRHLGLYEQAVVDYSQAILLRPEYDRAYFGRGGTYVLLEDFTAALTDYNRVLEINPAHADAFASRALLSYAQSHSLEAASADLAQAMALRPDDPLYMLYTAEVLADAGQLDRALEYLDRAIALTPDYAQLYIERGYIHNVQFDFRSAIVDYDRAVALRPDDVQGYFGRGIAYHNLEAYDAAIVDLTRAIELNPTLVDAFFLRGDSYYMRGVTTRSIPDLEAALRDLRILRLLGGENIGERATLLLDELERVFEG